MKDNTQYIISICKRLAEKGIEPSVAMIRSKSQQKLAIPQVIQVLKAWKLAPEKFAHDTTEHDEESTDSEPHSLEQRVEYLERQVAILSQKLQDISQAK